MILNKRRGFYEYNRAVQSISAGTDTEVNWNTTIFENAPIRQVNNRFYQNASTVAGTYLITGFVHVNTATATTNPVEVC